VTVSFEVLQPPVDGGRGRVYLLGTGVAGIDDGVVTWTQAPAPLTLGAAFAGGELALATGRELRLVDRDGSVRQSFAVAAGETIQTPPAIAPDGSVWLATEAALYAAR
jgi:hypothetical protein